MRRPSQVNLTPGSVIVFEGLDKSSKSTQLELLRAQVSTNRTLFTHMPSGLTEFSRQLYSLLETKPPDSGLARQLTHLACHGENISRILEAARDGSLVLDRWWWSTMAYGWYGGDIAETGLSESAFRELIECIWAPSRHRSCSSSSHHAKTTRTTSKEWPTAIANLPPATVAPSSWCPPFAATTRRSISSRHSEKPT